MQHTNPFLSLIPQQVAWIGHFGIIQNQIKQNKPFFHTKILRINRIKKQQQSAYHQNQTRTFQESSFHFTVFFASFHI